MQTDLDQANLSEMTRLLGAVTLTGQPSHQEPKGKEEYTKETLQKLHGHSRDAEIVFATKGHIYYVTPLTQTEPVTKIFTSVTTWNKGFFKEFDADEAIAKMKSSQGWKEGHKYWGMANDAIKSLWEDNRTIASTSGTDMHDNIETFLNLPCISPVTKTLISQTQGEILAAYMGSPILKAMENTKEWQGFLRYVTDCPTLRPYRTEWRIFHEELEIAGSIDIVYQDPRYENGLILADWKRSKEITAENKFKERGIHWALTHIHATNYWKYALQLNTYKYILETKYGKRVTSMFLVQIHPDLPGEKGYQLHGVADLSREIGLLVQSRLAELAASKPK